MFENNINQYIENINNILDNMNMFTKEELSCLNESIYNCLKNIINDNIEYIMNYNFDTYIKNYVVELFVSQLSEVYIDNIENLEIELQILIQININKIYKNFIPIRSYKNTFIRKDVNIENIKRKIEYIKNIPQPQQRTSDWYIFRHNLLTASSIWKIFSSQSTQNQLICEKCSSINVEKFKSSFNGINSTLHWGQKYEPISTEYYEKINNVKIGDFGCIKHPNYHFIGASPDGIVINEDSRIFGRMLEIKNIVNREINGIPKFEYWIQMQLQMETCDLNECDFLETKFIEYDSYLDFINDGTFTKSNDNKLKGIIVLFNNDNSPVYEYCPLESTIEEYNIWETNILNKHSDKEWVQNIYWKLEIVSCVLVLRNKLWFKKVISTIENFWQTIEYERNNGYEHRKPKKRSSPKLSSNNNFDINIIEIMNIE
jgi:putative phage-type endonuclease